jgi:AraC-like DNA-binding protein
MPDGDGIELCKRIKSNPETNNLPIIMLTSENSDRAQINSLNLDVDHFLTKPFNLLMLKSAIAQGIRVRERIIGSIRRTEVGYDYTSTKIDSADDKLFSRINESLKKHLDDSNFGVSELASDAGISRVHLNRKMKERYGISPNAFIRSYRLKQAAYLLVNNNVNVSEVAYRVGFSSHSHFSNTFHEYFGMTPKEFIAYYSENLNDEALQKLFEQ